MNSSLTATPLVTIVVPFYSSYAPYLKACLDSVADQTYSRWEMIVVDDASTTDDGREIVDAFGDPRITLVRHEQNRGQGAARNTGLRLGTGELIVPLDCDDMLAPTHLEKLTGALLAHPECNVAYSDYRLFSAVSKDQQFPQRDVRTLLKEQWLPHPGTMVRRVIWEQTDGYCEEELFRAGNEDWDYFLSVAEVGLKTIHIPEPLYLYRQHLNSITSTRFTRADYEMRERMYERHRELFDRYGMKRTFLAGGCRCSGMAFWKNGERVRGLKLLSRALWLDPLDFGGDVVKKVRQSHPYQLVATMRHQW